MKQLLEDDRFLDWYFRKDEASVAVWNTLMQLNPEWKTAQQEAVEFLNSLQGSDLSVSAERKAHAEARLAQMLSTAAQTSTVVPMRRSKSWLVWSMAASLLLAVAGIWFYRQSHGPSFDQQISAQYGQVSKAALPDGSEVVLNANSTIRYQQDWDRQDTREVWLEGEAFFHVQKTANRKKFIVHAPQFDVLVTGTQFNVVTRGKQSRVYLQEGSVTLMMADGSTHQMKPADMVTIEDRKIIGKDQADQNTITAWKERMIALDATSMSSIARIIENDYGVHVKLADSQTENQILGPGRLPNSSLEVLLETLRSTGNFSIERKADTVYIRFIGN